MGDLIPPEPEFSLTDEECEEYNTIKELIDRASTFREYGHLKRRIAAFMQRVEERRNLEKNT